MNFSVQDDTSTATEERENERYYPRTISFSPIYRLSNTGSYQLSSARRLIKGLGQ